MGVNDNVLEIVRSKGPVLPVEISKETKDSILISSAKLSELLSNKSLKISNLKVGGSPLYYVVGQESKLQDFSSHLKDKEKEAYEIIKSEKIVADQDQDPAIRVALRNIKDYAIPLEVSFNNEKKIFWKWYLLEPQEVQDTIRSKLSGQNNLPQENIEEKEQDKIPTNNQTQSNLTQPQTQPPIVETEPAQEEQNQKIVRTPEAVENKDQRAEELTKKKVETTVQKTITEQKPQIKKKEITRSSNKPQNFFKNKQISVLEAEDTKKNTEFDYLIELDTSLGAIKYFCKFKNKKKINEGDLSSAMVQAQTKGYPLLFLSDGTLTKKAEEKLDREFKNIIFRTI